MMALSARDPFFLAAWNQERSRFPDHAAEIDAVFGDPKAGPVAFQIELAPKSEAGMHKHTSDYHALVLEGPVGHWVDGGEEADKHLVAGTYWFQPGGQFHNDACRGDEPCRAFVFMPEAMDMMPQASE